MFQGDPSAMEGVEGNLALVEILQGLRLSREILLVVIVLYFPVVIGDHESDHRLMAVSALKCRVHVRVLWEIALERRLSSVAAEAMVVCRSDSAQS